MYKATVRALMRYSVKKLNGGDYSLILKMADPNFELVFPGKNSWSTMFRPLVVGRQAHATHRGIEEGTAFADRFVDEGVQFHIEDILVNGPPWNTRIALRVQSYVPAADSGADLYANRAVAILEIKWGRLTRWEDYEDTQRFAAWDHSIGQDATSGDVALR